jgi:hypothetical protein
MMSAGLKFVSFVVALFRPSLPKRGRSRIGDRNKTLAAQKPWEAEGMSRATWFRRRKEKREGRQ